MFVAPARRCAAGVWTDARFDLVLAGAGRRHERIAGRGSGRQAGRSSRFDNSRNIDIKGAMTDLPNLAPTGAVAALGALAHPGRLDVFRRLVRAGPEGLAAGEIARATGSLPNTLSSNLAILAGAGLVRSRREGRSIIYSADFGAMRALLAYLMDDCCGGRPEICADLSRVCAAPEVA